MLQLRNSSALNNNNVNKLVWTEKVSYNVNILVWTKKVSYTFCVNYKHNSYQSIAYLKECSFVHERKWGYHTQKGPFYFFGTLYNSLNACPQFRENLRWFWFFKTEQRRDLDSSKHGNNDIDERENQSKWNFKIAKASNTKNLDGNAESFSYSGKNTNWI